MKNLAIFASGSGSNAQAIMEYFSLNPSKGRVVAVVSNNSGALVLQRAEEFGVPAFVFTKSTIYNNPEEILEVLDSLGADFLVLAGFMLLVPEVIIDRFQGRIVNVHPALLPKFGGKGMYGDNVHKAVIEAAEKESGITIHFVNKRYDEGAIIFQAQTTIEAADTPESLANKIQKLEHEHFPRVIAEL